MSVQQEKQREASLRKESKGWRKTEEQQGMVGEDYNTNQTAPREQPRKRINGSALQAKHCWAGICAAQTKMSVFQEVWKPAGKGSSQYKQVILVKNLKS